MGMIGNRLRGIALAFIGANLIGLAIAAEPTGEYLFGGNGSMLITFDGTGNFSGIIASPAIGLDNITGTALVGGGGSFSGICTVTDRITGDVRFAGPLKGVSNANGLTFKFRFPQPVTLTGGPRTGTEPVPSGQYFVTALPTQLLIQCTPSGDRQLVTIQGDQDYGLDLTQAFGAQLLFNQTGQGFGVAYENSNPASAPRVAAGQYFPKVDRLALTLFQKPNVGLHKKYSFTHVETAGSYDGVYNVTAISAGGCSSITFTITIKGGIVTGSSAATGAITGTMDNQGNLNFTTATVIVPAGCPQSGTHANGTFTGTPLNSPVFPNIAGGNFTATGTSGTFVISQPAGVTGATTPPNLSRIEAWSGTLSGVHNSRLCPGGVFNESYSVSLTFPSSLIKALRVGPAILTGTGSMSGSETIKTQAPFPTTDCAVVANTLSGASVNITFAGLLSAPANRAIEFDSPSPLIPSLVQFFSGPDAGQTLGENLRIIRLRAVTLTATKIEGDWGYGKFLLHK